MVWGVARTLVPGGSAANRGSPATRRLRPASPVSASELGPPTAPHIDLDTHITDVVNVVRYEDLDDIVLLGFSYGGRPGGDRLCSITSATGSPSSSTLMSFCLDRRRDPSCRLCLWRSPQTGSLLPGRRGRFLPSRGEAGQSPKQDPVGQRVVFPAAHRRLSVSRCRCSRPVDDWPFTRTYIKATADPQKAPDFGLLVGSQVCSRPPMRGRTHEIEPRRLIPITRPMDELTRPTSIPV